MNNEVPLKFKKYLDTTKKILLWLIGIKRYEKWIPKLTVTILIPAYNEESYIKDTIQSVKNQTYPHIKDLIVIDDSSSDGTGEIARSEGVKVVRTPKNSGSKAQAVNYGLNFINQESCDITAIIDADTALKEDAIEKILAPFQDKNIAATCSYILPRYTKSLWQRGRLMQYLYYASLYKGAHNHYGYILVLSGCFSCYRTKVLKDAEGFPNNTLAEDMTLSWKLMLNKKKCVFVEDAIAYPDEPINYQLFKNQTLRWYRGFFQNIKLFKFSIFKNKRLGGTVYFYLINSIIELLFILPAIVIFIKNPHLLIVSIFAILLFTFIISMIKSVRLRIWKEALISFPSFFAVMPFDRYLFWKSFYLELIKGEKLEVWHKGH